MYTVDLYVETLSLHMFKGYSKQVGTTGRGSTLAQSLQSSLKDHLTLHLCGDVHFHQERRHDLDIFGFHALPKEKQASIGTVEFEGIREPHGTIPIRIFYPKAIVNGNKKDCAVAVYMHG